MQYVIAFLEGIITFISPCLLPMLPIYLSYFAGGGESLWEIAKSCHTSMEAVMEENGLAADVLPEDTMLLVPLC